MSTLNYERATFSLQSGNPEGVSFKVKPSTPKNREKIFEMFEEEQRRIEEDDEYDAEDRILDMIKAFAEPVDGDFSDLEPSELDQKEIEYYFQEGFI